MKNLYKYNVKEISNKKVKEISGGRYWNPIFLGIYLIDEVYDGLTRDCSCSCH